MLFYFEHMPIEQAATVCGNSDFLRAALFFWTWFAVVFSL
jgi:hypothetical protein